MRIVLIQANLLGDVIVTTPLLRHLRNSIPDARVAIVMRPKNRAIRPLLGDLLDDVLDFDTRPLAMLKFAARARAMRFDWLIDSSSDPLKSSPLLVRLIGAKKSVGLPNGHEGLYDIVVREPPIGTLHMADRYLTLTRAMGLPPPADPRIELTLPPEAAAWAKEHWPLQAGRPSTLVNISGTGPVKFWGVERFVALLRAAGAAHPELGFVIVGHERDKPAIDQIVQQTAAVSAPTTSDFIRFAAYVNRATYVITPDTSVIHLAAAWQKPTLGLYVARPPGDTWEPYRSPHVILQSPTVSVADISVEQGISGFERLLASVASPQTSGSGAR